MVCQRDIQSTAVSESTQAVFRRTVKQALFSESPVVLVLSLLLPTEAAEENGGGVNTARLPTGAVHGVTCSQSYSVSGKRRPNDLLVLPSRLN
jgi:hypothetical protein